MLWLPIPFAEDVVVVVVVFFFFFFFVVVVVVVVVVVDVFLAIDIKCFALVWL